MLEPTVRVVCCYIIVPCSVFFDYCHALYVLSLPLPVCLEIPSVYKISYRIVTCNNLHDLHQFKYHSITFASKVQSVAT